MYDAIKQISADLKCLATSVQQPERVSVICGALEKTAQELETAMTNAVSQSDRSQLSKLYQGILASQRLIQQLHAMQQPSP